MMGAGAAKALGAKKKWQTMAAGAAGGMFSTWMAGSSNLIRVTLDNQGLLEVGKPSLAFLPIKNSLTLVRVCLSPCKRSLAGHEGP
jgi:hypothetical protein